MKNLKVWIAFLAVFTSGVLVGITGLGMYIQSYFTQPQSRVNFETQMHDRLLQEIKDDVRPDAKDIPAISSLLREMIEEMEKIKIETDSRVREITDKNKQSIKEILTPEQVQRFDAMLRKERRGRGGLLKLPPPPPKPPK